MNECIKLETIKDGVYHLIFDKPDSGANVFDRATLNDLNTHLDTVTNDSQARGLVFTSAKPSIFIAGADISELLSEDITENDLRGMIRLGQKTFNRIAGLSVPTVAAIHGACLGGGYELCLACDYRIASDDHASRIGLPETSLGILPAWGGSTRLPRTIGLPKALDAILGGKRMLAKRAKKFGLIDQIVPREYFLRMALKKIETGKPSRPVLKHLNNGLVARILVSRIRPQLDQKTRGRYPAIIRALDIVSKGITQSMKASLLLEEEATVELVQTQACKNLVRVFFLQDRAKKLRVDTSQVPEKPFP
ncbi:MAG: hypothetical protein GKR87_14675 [Kiritimatiellae bacterium]|nr:hypothetical protein [Kiritimatiellia bacterium]